MNNQTTNAMFQLVLRSLEPLKAQNIWLSLLISCLVFIWLLTLSPYLNSNPKSSYDEAIFSTGTAPVPSDTIYYDDFKKDFIRCCWKTRLDTLSGLWSSKIDKGKYLIENKSDTIEGGEEVTSHTHIPLDKSLSYIIEIKLKVLTKYANQEAFLFWKDDHYRRLKLKPSRSGAFRSILIRKDHPKLFYLGSDIIKLAEEFQDTTKFDLDSCDSPSSTMTELGFVLDPGVHLEVEYILVRQNQGINIKPYPFPCFQRKKIKSINTKATENMPIISPDGQTLFFTRAKKDRDDNTQFELRSATRINRDFATDQEHKDFSDMEGIIGLSPNQEIFWSIIDREIFVWERTVKGWKKEALELHPLKSSNNIRNFNISSNGEVLLMTGPSGNGTNIDIYVSHKRGDSFSKPIPLGPGINSDGDELTPFLAPDNKTLYFSSDYNKAEGKGRPGYGKKDIFVSKRLDESWEKWSKSQNLGPAINTEADEWFFSCALDSMEYAYFTSNLTSQTGEDVYQVKIPSRHDPMALIYFRLVDPINKSPMEVSYYASRLEANRKLAKGKINEEVEKFKVIIPRGEKIALAMFGEGYLHYLDTLEVPIGPRDTIIESTLYLEPYIDIYQFKFDSKEILKGEEKKIQFVKSMMGRNESLCITIEGHASREGGFYYNDTLSMRRARSVANHLGFPKERVTVSWKGERDATCLQDTMEGQFSLEDCLSRDRRVVIKFTNCQS